MEGAHHYALGGVGDQVKYYHVLLLEELPVISYFAWPR